MSKIRLTCPTCRTPLEVDAAAAGEELECGSCLQLFVAGAPRPPSDPPTDRPSSGKIKGTPTRSRRRGADDPAGDDRPRRRRPRRSERDDDGDAFDHDPRAPGEAECAGFLAIASLILGVTSIMPGCCCAFLAAPLGLGAIVCGSLGRNSPGLRMAAVFGILLGHVALAFVLIRVVAGWGAVGFN